jgi:putative membrane protein
MRGKHGRTALIAALSMALMAGAACARNSEDDTTTGAVGTAQQDSAMGHRDTTMQQQGQADTTSQAQRDTTTMPRDTSTMQRDTSSTYSNPSSTSSNPSSTSPSTGSATTSPNSSSTSPNSGSTTTSPNSSSSSSTSSNPSSSSSTSTSTTTPQASGPSAAGYSYEPSVAAPWAAATGAGRQQKLSDATILATLDRADMADSAAGAVAMQKAANPQVKDYGRMMTRDHHQSHVKVMQLAKSLNISAKASNEDPISKTVTRDSTTLVSTPAGEQFDRTYIEQQIAMHKQVMEFAKQAEQSTANAQIKQHIQETSPVLQRHLQRAEEIQQSLGRMPA